jgi:multidrug efflux pump subunit AcrA (membrane-fusion protein)
VQVPVRLVRREEGRVLLEGTLQQGEQVVVEGVQRLREGAAVEALNTAATAPASRPASAAAAAGHMPRPAAP